MGMKITIDTSGNLNINGEDRYCPYALNKIISDGDNGIEKIFHNNHCGYWCALFGEPEPNRNYFLEGDTKIQLCVKSLFFDKKKFKDERK